MTVSPKAYDQALRLYRGGFVDDWPTISEHTGLTEEEIEALVLEGGAGRPSFVRVLQDQLATQANARNDWALACAKAAATVAGIRVDTLRESANIEKAIMGAWGTKCREAIVAAKIAGEHVKVEDLIPPKGTVTALRVLRVVMDQTSDVRAPAELFSGHLGAAGEGTAENQWSLVDDLLDLSEEEMEAYVETGKIPKQEGGQRVLPFARAAAEK